MDKCTSSVMFTNVAVTVQSTAQWSNDWGSKVLTLRDKNKIWFIGPLVVSLNLYESGGASQFFIMFEDSNYNCTINH